MTVNKPKYSAATASVSSVCRLLESVEHYGNPSGNERTLASVPSKLPLPDITELTNLLETSLMPSGRGKQIDIAIADIAKICGPAIKRYN